jgi:perosamine synthetase
MPNLNACLGLAQLELLPQFLEIKRELFQLWSEFFAERGIEIKGPAAGAKSNHWLIPVEFKNPRDRSTFLRETNDKNIGTRPIWTLMSKLPMYRNCYNDGLKNSKHAEEHFVCIPSGVPIRKVFHKSSYQSSNSG